MTLANGDGTAVAGLIITMICTLVVTTWRFATLSTKMQSTVDQLKEKEKEQDSTLKEIRDLPLVKQRMEFLETNFKTIPRLNRRVHVIESRLNIRPSEPSHPDEDEEEST